MELHEAYSEVHQGLLTLCEQIEEYFYPARLVVSGAWITLPFLSPYCAFSIYKEVPRKHYGKYANPHLKRIFCIKIVRVSEFYILYCTTCEPEIIHGDACEYVVDMVETLADTLQSAQHYICPK